MTASVVVFDPALFVQRYRQFAGLDPALLQSMFDEAALICNNGTHSLVRDLAERAILLGKLTAHIATLSGAAAPGGAGSTATQVGRVSSASEGSVSASLDAGPTTAANAWYMQTQYGAEYWQLTAKYRTARFIRPRHRC